MKPATVIARAYGGEPLKRIATGVGKGLVYVANPALLRALETGESLPVGFPDRDVFEFDPEAYRALAGEWARSRKIDGQMWSKYQLRLYRPA